MVERVKEFLSILLWISFWIHIYGNRYSYLFKGVPMTDIESYARDLVDSCKDHKGGFDREAKWLSKDLEGKITRAIQQAEQRGFNKGIEQNDGEVTCLKMELRNLYTDGLLRGAEKVEGMYLIPKKYEDHAKFAEGYLQGIKESAEALRKEANDR